MVMHFAVTPTGLECVSGPKLENPSLANLADLAHWGSVPSYDLGPIPEVDITVGDFLKNEEELGDICDIIDALDEESISVDELESMVQSLDSDGLSSVSESSESSEELDVNISDEKKGWFNSLEMEITDVNSADSEPSLQPLVELFVPEEPAEVVVQTEVPSMMPTPPLSPDYNPFDIKEELEEMMENEIDDYNEKRWMEEDAGLDYPSLRIKEWSSSPWETTDPMSHYKQAILHDCWWNGLCKDFGCKRNTAEPSSSDISDLTDIRRKTARGFRRVSRLDLSVCRSFSPDHQPLSPMFWALMPPESQEAPHVVAAYPHSDHSYHASRIPSPEPEPPSPAEPVTTTPAVAYNRWQKVMGLETPSDSEEEEIDVVNVSAVHPENMSTTTLKANNNATPVHGKELELRVQRAFNPTTTKPAQKRGRKRGPRRLKLTLKRAEGGDPNIYHATKSTAKRARGSVGRPSKQLTTGYLGRYNQRMSPLSSAASSSSEDGQDKEKRREHNDMERRRRNDLKSCFDNLRKLVPSIQNLDRAAKVLILGKSRDFIYQERERERKLHDNKEILRRQNEQLKKKVLELTRRALGKTA